MRTRIRGRWVVGYNHGHGIIPDGEVVYEDDKIVFVGRGYQGPEDRFVDAGDKLVSPGFVNLHATTNVDVQIFRIDGEEIGFSKPKSFVARWRDPEVLDEAANDASARFSVACMIRGGATTFGAITTMAPKRWEDPIYEPRQIARAAGEMGGRAYVAHQVRAYTRCVDGFDSVEYLDEERAAAGLERAKAFAKEIDGSYDGRIRPYFFPYTLDASTPDLLKGMKAAANDFKTHMRTHFSQSWQEVQIIQRRYGLTPVKYLDSLGVLDRNTILTHALYIAGNGPYADPQDEDLKLLAERGVTVCHDPWVYLRRGKTLNNFDRYRAAGINLGIGTDMYPQDSIAEMRGAALGAKFENRTTTSGSAASVFEAGTIGGARALGRDDLGRLAPGAKADLVIVDMTRLHIGPVPDPIRALVHHASAADIDRVVIGGRTVVEDGKLLTADEAELVRKAQAPYDTYKGIFSRWDRGRRPSTVLFPYAVPMR
jgi:cytosine/adenosine deaminase-related metal-dependent hydrolase